MFNIKGLCSHAWRFSFQENDIVEFVFLVVLIELTIQCVIPTCGHNKVPTHYLCILFDYLPIGNPSIGLLMGSKTTFYMYVNNLLRTHLFSYLSTYI
jgi:hypothetical protein